MPHFDVNHAYAWPSARECFRIGLVPGIPPLFLEKFISNEENKTYMYHRITQLSTKEVIFDFDISSGGHKRWAALSLAVGC